VRSGALSTFVALLVVALDQWTKWLVEAHLPRGLSMTVIPGFLDLVHVLNTGAAFGILADTGAQARWVLLVLTGVALIGVILYFRAAAPTSHLEHLALGLIFGGAFGNLLDRVFAGAVTDFVDVYWSTHHWPAFNVADAAITSSLGLLLLASWRSRAAEAPSRSKEEPSRSEEEGAHA